ncbi:MAG: type II secretion system F family protein [Burkholderiales bacterium]
MKLKKLGWNDRVMCYRHLSVQIANDRPVILALEDLKKRAQRKKKPALVGVVTDIIRRMQNGASLSAAFSGKVPQDEIMIISSGDLSGSLPMALDLVIESKERTQRVTRSLKSAMTPPAIFAAVLYGMLFAIGKFVVPSLAEALPASKARGSVAVLYAMGEFFSGWWAAVPIVVVAILALVVVLTLSTFTGKWRVKAEVVFPWSFYRDINGYSWMLSFLALLQAGMSNTEILDKQLKTATPWLAERLKSASVKMKNGDSLSSALMKGGFGFPNPDMIEDIASMEIFPDFPERMSRILGHWADELERTTIDKTKAAGFIMEVAMYGIMLFLVLSTNSMTSQISATVGG